MDIFGIGAAVKGAAEIYFRSARQTGRTTQFISRLQDGDTVYCLDSKQGKEIENRCKALGVKIYWAVIDTKCPREVFDRRMAMKRAFFDHAWIEQYYLEAIQKVTKEIKFFEDESSKNHVTHNECEDSPMRILNERKWRI